MLDAFVTGLLLVFEWPAIGFLFLGVFIGIWLLYMSGQVGSEKDGSIASDFEAQMRRTYANIEEILKEAGMGLQNLVKVTTFLTGREYLADMRRIRSDILGDHRPAHTLLIVAGLAYEEFLIEVECVAAAES